MEAGQRFWSLPQIDPIPGELLAGFVVWFLVFSWSSNSLERTFRINEPQAIFILLAACCSLVLAVHTVLQSARSARSTWTRLLSTPHVLLRSYAFEPACIAGPAPFRGSYRAEAVAPAESQQALPIPATNYYEMSSREFEDAIAALFVRWGFRVQQTPYANDGGKDAIAWRGEAKYLIECKRYQPAQPVHRRDLQILVAAMKDESAVGGFFVTTGRFTRASLEYAPQHNIELLNGPALVHLANELLGIKQQELFAEQTKATPLRQPRPPASRRNANLRIHRGS